jgi:hypothetical protein
MQRPGPSITLLTFLVAPFLVTTLTFSSVVADPTVTGPVPSHGIPGDPAHNYVFYATPMDLKRAQYVEQEYFISGTATRYVIPNGGGELTSPGTMPYRTRIVVRRPANASKFSGVIVVDWQNVSAGHDTDTEWAEAGDFFVRAGWAWVGASVQRVGVHGMNPPSPIAGQGLKQWSPARYGELDLTNGGTVTDDSQAFDVYSQVAQLLKHPQRGSPFDGMRVRRVYAGGNSQSAQFLVRYYNHIQPLTGLYDGFLIDKGGESPRLDLRTKLFKVYTEADVGRQASLRVPDTDVTHTWETTGAPHMPSAWQSLDKNDFRATAGAIAAREFGLTGSPLTSAQCVHPYPSPVESWVVHTAAYAALDRWVTRNVRPSVTPRIQTAPVVGSPLHTVLRDNHGIALGGIRLPRVSLPTAMSTGDNQPASPAPENGVCGLFGTHVPFDAVTLKTLYPTRAAYVRDVRRVVDDLVKFNVVLKEDAAMLIRRAEASIP